MLFLIFVINIAFSYEAPRLYVGNNGAIVYNPKTGTCFTDEKSECVKMAAGEIIENVILLNSQGDKYEPNQNQSPYYFKGQRKLGIIYKGKTATLELSDLTRRMPIKMGVRTPDVEKKDCCNSTSIPSKDATLNLLDIKKTLESKDSIKIKLKEFHNHVCDTRRPKNPETMDKEILNLFSEWKHFINNQPSEEDKKNAEKAFEVDVVSRTVLYETHPLGKLDSKTPSDCINDQDCPYSACERKVITLSIFNRANHPGCASGQHYYGCKKLKDYLNVASKPSQYSIWNPTLTSVYMATCFLKDGLEDLKLDQDYKQRILQFKKAVETTSEILYSNKPYNNIHYQEYGDGSPQGISKYTNYYHPQGMLGCFQESFNNQYGTQIAYVEKNGNYGIMVLETIVPDNPHASKTTFKMHKWNKPKNLNSENITYSLSYYENDGGWTISTDQIEKLKPRYNCTNMGLSILSQKPQACSQVPKQHSFTSPLWAIEPPAKRAQFTCQIGTQEVTLGGECDTRFQPISGVP